MDPISGAASIIALIQLAEEVIKVCKFYVDAVQDAPRDFHLILSEISGLKAIFEELDDKRPGVEATIASCRSSVSELSSLLPSLSDISKNGERPHKRVTWDSLAWPMKQSKARKLLAEIGQYKVTILLSLAENISRDVKAIKINVEKIETQINDAHRNDILEWLEVTNTSEVHNQNFAKHEEHTSSWILRSAEWNAWLEDANGPRLLWVHGIPGAGKTILASFLIEELRARCSSRDNEFVAIYYCLFSHHQDEGSPFMSSIVAQMCRALRWIPHQLRTAWDQGARPHLKQLTSAMVLLLERTERVYIVIDAVDESVPRDQLLGVLCTLATQDKFQKLRILATSRLYWDIEQVLRPLSAAMSMSNPLVAADIKLFVHHSLRDNSKLLRWSHLFEPIENALSEGAQGMFRWAVCQIHLLERIKFRTDEEVLKELRNLPKDLDETYIRVFASIPEEEKSIVQKALAWIRLHSMISSYRILTAELLIKLVFWDPHDSSKSKAQVTDTDIADFRDLCGCLVTLSSDRFLDREESIDGDVSLHSDDSLEDDDLHVSLAHYTVAEFLSSDRIAHSEVADFFDPDNALFKVKSKEIIENALAQDLHRTTISYTRYPEPYFLLQAVQVITKWRTFFDGSEAVLSDGLWPLVRQFMDPNQPHYNSIRYAAAEHVSGDLVPLKSQFKKSVDTLLLPWWPNLSLLPSADIAVLQGLIMADYTLGLLKACFAKSNAEIGQMLDSPAGGPAYYTWYGPQIGKFMRGDMRPIYMDSSISVTEVHAVLGPRRYAWFLRHFWPVIDLSRFLSCAIATHEWQAKGVCRCQSTTIFSPGENSLRKHCFIDWLLAHGAKPEGSGRCMTALQISVSCWDAVASRTLLEAGADVNGLGDSSGGPVPFLRLDMGSLSPLRILRERKFQLQEDLQGLRESEIQVIGDLLLSYGAKDFARGEKSL